MAAIKLDLTDCRGRKIAYNVITCWTHRISCYHHTFRTAEWLWSVIERIPSGRIDGFYHRVSHGPGKRGVAKIKRQFDRQELKDQSR